MSSYILFVFEGKKTEKQVYDSLTQYYLNETSNTKVISSYCGEIYSLYHTMQKDPDLDLFCILKDKMENLDHLTGISRHQISEIFLFFDYDGHAPAATDEKLRYMLSHFDEETENGKLYISYPMVESLKHLNINTDFNSVTIDGKSNIGYKQLVNNSCENCYKDLSRLSQVNWTTIISEHCKKLNHLMLGEFSIPTNITSQKDIFLMQYEKHIEPYSKVAVLSAFPIFIFDYYGSLPMRT